MLLPVTSNGLTAAVGVACSLLAGGTPHMWHCLFVVCVLEFMPVCVCVCVCVYVCMCVWLSVLCQCEWVGDCLFQDHPVLKAIMLFRCWCHTVLLMRP